MMNIEAEVKEIKQRVIEISKKIEDLMYEKEITAITFSLHRFNGSEGWTGIGGL